MGISFGVILSEVSIISSEWVISFGVILSEVSIISSVEGYYLALYCLRSVSYRQNGDIIWRYTVSGQYHIVRVGDIIWRYTV